MDAYVRATEGERMTGWIALIIAIVILTINVYFAGRYNGYLKGHGDAVIEMTKRELDHIKDILERGHEPQDTDRT